MSKVLEHHYDLNRMALLCIDQLRRPLYQRNHPFREMYMATAGEEGADVRTVICRKVHPEPLIVEAYTDVRSEKVKQLKAQSMAALLFWNPKSRLQIKLKARASVHFSDEITKKAWQEIDDIGRAAYSSKLPPGTFLPAQLWHASTSNPDAGASHFALIRLAVYQMEALQLSKEGHIRAAFDYRDGKLHDSRFLVP